VTTSGTVAAAEQHGRQRRGTSTVGQRSGDLPRNAVHRRE